MFREVNEFPIEAQGRIASAICVVHNFIRIHDPKDLEEVEKSIEPTENERRPEGIINSNGFRGISSSEAKAAAEHRDKIAEDMWAQYQGYLNSNSSR